MKIILGAQEMVLLCVIFVFTTDIFILSFLWRIEVIINAVAIIYRAIIVYMRQPHVRHISFFKTP